MAYHKDKNHQELQQFAPTSAWMQGGERDWILVVPRRRLRNTQNSPVPLVASVAAVLVVVCVIAPPLVWLTGGNDNDNDDSTVITSLVFHSIPQVIASLLALQISGCFLFVGWHYFYYYQDGAIDNGANSQKRS